MTDVFAVQDEIAGAVVAALKVKLLPPGRPASSSGRTSNLEAYNQYLLGWHLLNLRGEENLHRSIEAFQKAISLDPGNPVSHLRYSNLLACLGRVPEAITEAKRAIDFDPLFSRAWGALGLCLIASDQLPEARKALSRAMEISPEDPQPHFYLAFISLLEGSPRAALQGFARIEDLAGRAMAEHDLGHAKESQQALDELIAKRASTFAFAGEIAGVYAWRGEKDKAFEWLDRAVAQHEEDPGTVKFDPQFSKLRDDPRYAALLKKVGLPAGS